MKLTENFKKAALVTVAAAGLALSSPSGTAAAGQDRPDTLEEGIKSEAPWTVMSMLSRDSAGVNTPDSKGRMPLHQLVTYSYQHYECKDMARALVAAGTDVTTPDRQGRTAAELADSRHMPELAQAIRDADAQKKVNTLYDPLYQRVEEPKIQWSKVGYQY